MRVLVTGSEGEVGSVLLPQLAKRFETVGFDRQPHKGSLEAIQGDLLDYEQIADALEAMEAVVHMAALLPAQGLPGASVDINVKATATLLQAAVDRGVRRFVYCSSVWATGHGFSEPYLPIDEQTPPEPVCMYGQTKWLGELMAEYYARQHGLEAVIIRFCGFKAVRGYDSEGRIDWAQADVPAIFLRYLGAGFKLMNPADLGIAFGQALDSPAAPGQRLVVGCYTPYTATDAAGLRSLPAAIVERYYPSVPELLGELGVEIPPVEYYFNHEKARARLGFRSMHDLGDVARLYREWRESQ